MSHSRVPGELILLYSISLVYSVLWMPVLRPQLTAMPFARSHGWQLCLLSLGLLDPIAQEILLVVWSVLR